MSISINAVTIKLFLAPLWSDRVSSVSWSIGAVWGLKGADTDFGCRQECWDDLYWPGVAWCGVIISGSWQGTISISRANQDYSIHHTILIVNVSYIYTFH